MEKVEMEALQMEVVLGLLSGARTIRCKAENCKIIHCQSWTLKRGYHQSTLLQPMLQIKSKPFIGNVSVSVAFSEVSIYVSPSAELSNYTPPPFPRRNTSIPNPQVGDTKTMLPFSNMKVRWLNSWFLSELLWSVIAALFSWERYLEVV